MRTTLCALALLALPALSGAATQTVTIEGMKFQPASVTVKRGDTVVWQNKDVVPHTATAAGKFDSKNIDGRGPRARRGATTTSALTILA